MSNRICCRNDGIQVGETGRNGRRQITVPDIVRVLPLLIVIMLSLVPAMAAAPEKPLRLRCERAVNPLGIDNKTPAFGWSVKDIDRGEIQSACQLIVSSSLAGIQGNSGDQWNSGKVASNRQNAVVYAGPPLASQTPYWWKVKVWDRDGNESPWSDAASFETAMLDKTDWKAVWVGGNFNQFRKEFTLPAGTIKRARLYASAVGYMEVHLNGKKIGDEVLSPGETKYFTRGQSGKTLRALYRIYDVTAGLQPGGNAVGMMAGLGFSKLSPWPNDPVITRVILQLEAWYENNTRVTVVSDQNWQARQGGPVTYADVYNGENYDARKEDNWGRTGYNASGWVAPTLKPSDFLLSSQLQVVRVMERIKPVKMHSPASGKYIFDMGKNIAGWIRLTVQGAAGTEVVMRHAELLNSNGTLNPLTNKDALATDKYILKGGGTEVWEPRFTFHGFRFVELSGFPGTPTIESVEGHMVHDDVETVGYFSSSNTVLNGLHKMFVLSQADNMHSIPSDCPQRNERAGWGGDALVASEAAMYNFDLSRFYDKWFTDLDDNQADNGRTTDVAPFNWIGGEDHIAWKAAHIMVPWHHYQFYGDETVLAKHYDKMKKLIDWMQTVDNSTFLMPALYAPYGADHQTLVGLGDPQKMSIATAYYFKCTELLSRIAGILGKTSDSSVYAQLAANIRTNYNQAWLGADNNYISGYQIDNAMPLHFGITPESKRAAVLAKLQNRIQTVTNKHLETGILGSFAVMNALFQEGDGGSGYALATQTTYPGWGYMLAQGATTYWALWSNTPLYNYSSQNHPMTGGGLGSWVFKAAAGIVPTAPGFAEIQIKPQVAGYLTSAQCSVKTVRGLVSSEWTANDGRFDLAISVPVNSKALVYIPTLTLGPSAAVILEGGVALWRKGTKADSVNGAVYAGTEGNYVKWNVGSGDYRFIMSAQDAASIIPPLMSIKNLPGRYLQFSIPGPGPFVLSMYTVCGKRVSLKKGNAPAMVKLAAEEYGQGIYFVRIFSNSRIQELKLPLMR